MSKLAIQMDPSSVTVVRNTLWGLVAEASRIVSSFGVFLVLTHVYDVGTYGVLVGASALMTFVLPWSSLGAGYLLLERVAGDSWDHRRALQQATGAALLGGSTAATMIVFLGGFLFPQASFWVLATIAVSELVANALLESCLFLAQASGRLRSMAVIRAGIASMRLAAAIALLVLFENPSLVVWTSILAATGLLAVLGSELAVTGRVVVPGRPTREDAKSGLAYSVGFGAQKLWENADSSMLVRYDRSIDAGIHGAAIRLVWLASAPVFALLSAANSQIFAAGRLSSASARRVAVRLSAPAAIYGGMVGLALTIAAPRVVAVLPDGYVDAVAAVRWLGFLPALLGLGVFAATALSAIGHNGRRIRLMVLTAVLNIVLNAALIPAHGWRGAVGSTLGTQLAYVVAVWSSLWVLSDRHGEVERDGAEVIPHADG